MRYNWRHAIRQLVAAYPGMTPQAIGQLSLYQFRILADDESSITGKKKMDRDAFMRERARRMGKKQG